MGDLSRYLMTPRPHRRMTRKETEYGMLCFRATQELYSMLEGCDEIEAATVMGASCWQSRFGQFNELRKEMEKHRLHRQALRLPA